MTALGDYCQGLVDRLTVDAPTPVTVDPALLAPFILVDLPHLTATSGIGAWAAIVPIKCVVGAPGDLTARDLLLAMVEHVLKVLPAALPAEPGTYRPTVDAALPMYELAYPCQIPNPNC